MKLDVYFGPPTTALTIHHRTDVVTQAIKCIQCYSLYGIFSHKDVSLMTASSYFIYIFHPDIDSFFQVYVSFQAQKLK